jgi:hypothetical protein
MTPPDPDLRVRPGVVTLVDVRPSGHDVGIHLTTETPKARIVRPRRFAVHFDPMDDADDCWRCTDNRHRAGDSALGDKGLGSATNELRDGRRTGEATRIAPLKLVASDRARPLGSVDTDKLVPLCEAK